MSNGNDNQVIELIQNFFLKSAGLVTTVESNRYSLDDTSIEFDDEWFDMNIDVLHDLPPIIDKWTNFDGTQELPPLVIETFLDLHLLPSSYTVRLRDDESHLWAVSKGNKKSEIVLERWLIELDKESTSFKNHVQSGSGVSPEKLDQQLRLLFRYLFTLLQLLPSNDLMMALNNQSESHNTPIPVDIKTRILDGSQPILSKGRIGLSRPIISSYSNIINNSNIPAHLEQKKITPVWTKYGLLRISVSYRRDCQFIFQDLNEDNSPNTQITNQPAKTNEISISLSPRSKNDPNQISHPSWQKKFISSSKQFQPFIVGSVGSANTPNQNSSRNPSNSSVVGPHYHPQHRLSIGSSTSVSTQPNYEGTSVGSTSKFASSFNNLRRHSSVRYHESTEKLAKTDKNNYEDTDDLMEFVRLIEAKPELQPKKGLSGLQDKNLSGSILRYQKLRPSNDMLSEDLALSVSIDPIHGSQRRNSNSHSHSPVASFSPSGHFSSINSKLSQPHLAVRGSSSTVNSRRNSVDKVLASALSPIYGGDIPEYHTKSHNPVFNEVDDEEEGNDDLLVNKIPININKHKMSTSPRSIDSISNSLTRNRTPFRQPYQYSQPTTIATQAYAKMHRPTVRSSDAISEINSRKGDNFHQLINDNDEDDLVFFMSDMNLTRE